MTRFNGSPVIISDGAPAPARAGDEAGRDKTLAYRIMSAHSQGADGMVRVKFDALISHDITYVGVVQTALSSGLTEFPVPYALTCCHNSLCAVGGTINADDHAFGLSAAVKYGGIFVPPNVAVIHQYARDRLAVCGGMVLGSDSHTRYGALGTLGVGEGGGELVKQLLGGTWDLPEPPRVVLVWLEGKPRRGVGPHDIALALVAETFPEGRVKNAVLEFGGPGVSGLSMDYRLGIDVMTTETGCLSSIWETDGTVREFYKSAGEPERYRELKLSEGAYYDAIVRVDLSKAECMIAPPFHPSRAVPVHTFNANAAAILAQVGRESRELYGDGVPPVSTAAFSRGDGGVYASQGVIVGCAGGLYENIAEAAAIVSSGSAGYGGAFDFSVYPASAPVALSLSRDGTAARLLESGVLIKQSFCGPCFGAGDTPKNGGIALRHATRNFPSREGAKPQEGQCAYVFLMDARSIAASALNGGRITAATDIDYSLPETRYVFDGGIYERRVYNGVGRPEAWRNLELGPNIAPWPEILPLAENLLLRLTAVIHDEVTTTDELIPSGETSSYRSNPVRLAQFTLSRRVPDYVRLCGEVQALESERGRGGFPREALAALEAAGGVQAGTEIGSCVFARKPGDGSAREQAASCQKILGTRANIAFEYATKRYRSNCVNWGILPFTVREESMPELCPGSWVYVPGIRDAVLSGAEEVAAVAVTDGKARAVTLYLTGLDERERGILADGCLMNNYAKRKSHGKDTDDGASR